MKTRAKGEPKHALVIMIVPQHGKPPKTKSLAAAAKRAPSKKRK